MEEQPSKEILLEELRSVLAIRQHDVVVGWTGLVASNKNHKVMVIGILLVILVLFLGCLSFGWRSHAS